jgi:hypothetical protein
VHKRLTPLSSCSKIKCRSMDHRVWSHLRPNTATIEFQLLISTGDLPGGDLLIAKEMLQHLPNKTVTEYIAVIAHRYRFALLTDAIEPVEREYG